MKNKTLYTALAYWFLVLGLVLILSGCRTKKSKTDLKQTETENVSIVDNSTIAKKETVQENTNLSESAKWSDKSFFEAWMSFESDKITITDKSGTIIEITNPRYNKKSSQSNDISKIEQSTEDNTKVATNEENHQNDVKVNANKKTKTDLKKTDERKTKIVWFWVIIAAVIVFCFVYLINRYSKKSN